MDKTGRWGRSAALITAGILGLGATACGGGGGAKETAQLRGEVAALRQQLTTTSSSTATTATSAPTSTSTTTKPAPVTTAPRPVPTTTTTQLPTTTTQAPTTTTTRKQPQGTVTWTLKINAIGGGPYSPPDGCGAAQYHVVNRSDTAVLNVTISGVWVKEGYYSDGAIHTTPYDPGYQYRNGASLPTQTVPAGIAPYGETDINVSWCPSPITQGTFEWYEQNDRANLAWQWVQ